MAQSWLMIELKTLIKYFTNRSQQPMTRFTSVLQRIASLDIFGILSEAKYILDNGSTNEILK